MLVCVVGQYGGGAVCVLCDGSGLNILKFSFFFNDTATTEIYTLFLHDALPISEIYDGFGVNNNTDTNH